MLNTVSEVRMPIRFIFVLMGPVTVSMFTEDYHEIGRAMSTLMSYKVSHLPLMEEEIFISVQLFMLSREMHLLLLSRPNRFQYRFVRFNLFSV